MSSSNRLNMLVDSAWKNDDISSLRDAFNDFYDVNCLHPQKVNVFDAHTQTMHDIYVPCGKCEHCISTKINEWCTRMYAHAEDFKHVYFVTLTYRSFYDDVRPVNKIMLNKLKDAIWHRDSYNSTKHLCYSPCLLVKKHYQDFLKRLRKNTGLKDLSFVLSGENGHDYGRPHFHMILFTNGQLTKHDIDRAWSVALWYSNTDKKWSFKTNQKKDGSAHYFSIGRTDFNDLVSNGTFNTTAKIRVDGTYMNAANCFSYVCKYVCKNEQANMNRVRIAYNSLFQKKQFTNIYDNEIEYSIVKDYMRNVGYNWTQIDDIINNNKLITYEKTLFVPSPEIYAGATLSKDRKITTQQGLEFVQPIYDENYFNFRHDFSPFCEFSRGVPIGSIYASRNLSQFKEGIFTKPILQESGFVVPSYFRRKASESLYGLRKARKTFSGTTYVLDGLINLYGRFAESLKNGLPPIEHFTTADTNKTYEKALHDPYCQFRDLSSGENIILADGFARHYKYDRHSRSYLSTRNVPLADFIRYWCKSMLEEQDRHRVKMSLAKQNAAALERSQLIALDFGDDLTTLKERHVQKREDIKRDLSLLYHEIHKSAE